MNKYKKYLLIGSFLGITFGTSINFFVSEKVDTSFFENRALASFPKYSNEKLFDGSLMKEYENYFVDHFPQRDMFVELYRKYEIASSKTFVNGYHLTDDGWILTKPINTIEEDKIIEAANKVEVFSRELDKRKIDLTYVVLPSKMNSVSPNFPSYVDKGLGKEKSELLIKKLNENVKVINLRETLFNNLSQDQIDFMYFKTDHHWNGHGVYQAYKQLVDELELPRKEIKSYFEAVYAVNSEFYGSENRQVGGLVDSSTEEQVVYLPTKEDSNFKNLELYTSWDSKNLYQVEWDSFFASSLKNNNKTTEYGQLFSGDIPLVRVINKNPEANGKILIVKDSFTNAMFPYLANHFEEITLYDVRHTPKKYLLDFIDENDFDKVLIMYNDATTEGYMFDF